ncbi:ABC transporter permease [Corynebacterium cystitidis]|uniref:ABC-2 type transport system permease protein n=1 Tax=Corynebacterium cystitidis DSM 20524 TaxID=1121357 RepID=A0A1H9TDP3_9CORY|nr:ABC transporter permease [Corynebacterium cystitidis]WJY83560.1 ABC-2 family transporter protein [Corynebacterium cystitidis DSM 20524]SER94939.1 hypothetical protein SAMN05661109_01416 [Corynebacterium cystitidis DSM 20524]SNV92074.1 Uncharacterized protein conserved in bacteria [Corynebacterium cystitidis]
MRTLLIEYAKLKRSRILVLTLGLSAVIVMMSSMGFGRDDQVASFVAEPEQMWAGHLVGYIVIYALITPLQLAIIASRLADLEHLAHGWRLNAIVGTPPGDLLGIKFFVLGSLTLLAKVVEATLLVAIPVLVGAPPPPNLATIAVTCLALYGTALAIGAVFISCATLVESQLVVLGLGVVGGMLANAAMLSPVWVAAINPFGYFAMVTPYTFAEGGVVPVTPNWLAWGCYLGLALGFMAVLSRRINRKEI